MDATTAPLDQLLTLLQQDPDNPSLLGETVNVALQVGALDRAHALAEAALARAPQSAELRHLMSTVHLAGGRLEEALALLQGLLDEGLRHPGVLYNHAYANFRLQRYEAAVASFQPLLQLPPAPPAGTLAGLMRSLRHLGRHDEALAAWEAAPPSARDPQALGVASLLYFDRQALAPARQLADAALQGPAPAIEAQVARAGLALLDDDSATAVTLLEQAAARNPQDPRIWSALAAASLSLRDLPKAQAASERAAGLSPRQPAVWCGMAWSQLAAGQPEQARLSFQKALELDPGHAEAHGGLAWVLALSGQREEARRAAERARLLDAQGFAGTLAQALLDGQITDMASIQHLVAQAMGRRQHPEQRPPSQPLH